MVQQQLAPALVIYIKVVEGQIELRHSRPPFSFLLLAEISNSGLNQGG